MGSVSEANKTSLPFECGVRSSKRLILRRLREKAISLYETVCRSRQKRNGFVLTEKKKNEIYTEEGWIVSGCADCKAPAESLRAAEAGRQACSAEVAKRIFE